MVQRLGGVRPAARKLLISTTTLDSYKNGASEPTRPRLIRMAEEAGVDLTWLATGRGQPDGEGQEFVSVPRYDATLAAGAGSWNDGRRHLDDIPFTTAFLRRRLRRPSIKGLAILEARGDSMEPTIANGALLLIDENDTWIDDGVYAFVQDDVARVKRFVKLIDACTLISDNPKYPAETVQGEDMAKLQVIGHVLWVGQLL